MTSSGECSSPWGRSFDGVTKPSLRNLSEAFEVGMHAPAIPMPRKPEVRVDWHGAGPTQMGRMWIGRPQPDSTITQCNRTSNRLVIGEETVSESVLRIGRTKFRKAITDEFAAPFVSQCQMVAEKIVVAKREECFRSRSQMLGKSLEKLAIGFQGRVVLWKARAGFDIRQVGRRVIEIVGMMKLGAQTIRQRNLSLNRSPSRSTETLHVVAKSPIGLDINDTCIVRE
jgi:hypothetical protein